MRVGMTALQPAYRSRSRRPVTSTYFDLLRLAMRALASAARTELPQLHALRIIFLILRRDIVPLFALGAGERHQNPILFTFGRHVSPVLQPSLQRQRRFDAHGYAYACHRILI